jgi:hypothetical protein
MCCLARKLFGHVQLAQYAKELNDTRSMGRTMSEMSR